MKSRDLHACALIAATLLLCGCATRPERTAGDPFEPMNRAIYSFNDKLDKYVARPTATAYQKVTPAPMQTGVRNFFSNLGDIGNFANDALQLKVTDATEDAVRFAFNSTLGIGGLIDWATPAGLPRHHQDFGLTLARYGVPIGPYLVLPVFGPSSVRDVSDVPVNGLLNPFSAASAACPGCGGWHSPRQQPRRPAERFESALASGARRVFVHAQSLSAKAARAFIEIRRRCHAPRVWRARIPVASGLAQRLPRNAPVSVG